MPGVKNLLPLRVALPCRHGGRGFFGDHNTARRPRIVVRRICVSYRTVSQRQIRLAVFLDLTARGLTPWKSPVYLWVS